MSRENKLTKAFQLSNWSALILLSHVGSRKTSQNLKWFIVVIPAILYYFWVCMSCVLLAVIIGALKCGQWLTDICCFAIFSWYCQFRFIICGGLHGDHNCQLSATATSKHQQLIGYIQTPSSLYMPYFKFKRTTYCICTTQLKKPVFQILIISDDHGYALPVMRKLGLR